MSIFHIDADAFFASVEQGFNPALRGKPVIVGGLENQRGVVHTASYQARAEGVHTGMPLSQAKRICPKAIFLKGNFQHYQAASRTMQEIYLRYTPAVEFTSLDDAYLDMAGAAHLYPSMEGLARRIQYDVGEALGITVSVGMGYNKLIARIASGLNKPNGIFIVPNGGEKAFLQNLSIDEIPGVGPATREQLNELGVFTVGQVAALSKLVMSELFGANGAKIWEYANAIDRRTVHRRILPRQISRETTFEEDLTDRAVVMATLQYLTERIALKLRQDRQECRAMGVKIRYSDFTRHHLTQKTPGPTDNALKMFETVQEIVKRIPFRRLRIRHVGVQSGSIEWKQARFHLFETNDERAKHLDSAVDDIRGRFGFTAILPADTLSLQNKYRMDKNGYVLHSPALTR